MPRRSIKVALDEPEATAMVEDDLTPLDDLSRSAMDTHRNGGREADLTKSYAMRRYEDAPAMIRCTGI